MWQFSHLFKIIIRAIAKQFTFFFALDYYFSLNRTVAVATTADISTKFAVHCVRSSMAEDVTGFYACWNAVVHLKNASKNYYAPLERIICIFTVKARKQETNEWEQRRAPTNSFFFFFLPKDTRWNSFQFKYECFQKFAFDITCDGNRHNKRIIQIQHRHFKWIECVCKW